MVGRAIILLFLKGRAMGKVLLALILAPLAAAHGSDALNHVEPRKANCLCDS